MKAAHAAFVLVTALLSAHCVEGEPYVRPEPRTSPEVTVSAPAASQLLTEAEYRVDPTFGANSTDLKFLVASLELGGSARILDFSKPERQRLLGYGRYAGLTETYRRSRMADEYGVHGTRTAIFRADSEGIQTQVWYNHLAKGLNGIIYLTQLSRWEWLDGNASVTEVPTGAWAMLSSVDLTRYYSLAILGLHPGIWNLDEPMTREFISTDAVAPTSGITDCVLYYQNSVNESERYLAYFHESWGTVEIVYEWESQGFEVLPIDGFSLEAGSVSGQVAEETTYSALAGTWRGSLVPSSVEDTMTYEQVDNQLSVAFSVELDLSTEGFGYNADNGTYFVEGRYIDPYTGVRRIYGHYHETKAQDATGNFIPSGFFDLTAASNENLGGNTDSVSLWGQYVYGNSMTLNFRMTRGVGDQFYAVKGEGVLSK